MIPAEIASKVRAGERLSVGDGALLGEVHDLPALGMLADLVRQRKNPGRAVTYVVGRNVNYTNVCWVRCKFCAFYRVPGHTEGYVLTTDEILGKIREMVKLGGIEVLLQGGLNPRLHIDWYEALFGAIKREFGRDGVILHALSPAEITYVAKISRIPLEAAMARLRSAGLDSIPGGGAEVLTDSVREQIAPLKTSADEWIGCMRTAHKLGIRSTATMMYGSVEKWSDRVEHLERVRDLQDETGGFTAFIAWSFQPDGTDLPGTRASAFDYLRTVSTARLYLDNVPHMQASWVTQGPKIAQIALAFGLDDFGSTMIEENVVSAAGCSFAMPIDELERIIREAGYTPIRRTTQYQILAGS